MQGGMRMENAANRLPVYLHVLCNPKCYRNCHDRETDTSQVHCSPLLAVSKHTRKLNT
jgi:hypothetical protein